MESHGDKNYESNVIEIKEVLSVNKKKKFMYKISNETDISVFENESVVVRRRYLSWAKANCRN